MTSGRVNAPVSPGVLLDSGLMVSPKDADGKSISKAIRTSRLKTGFICFERTKRRNGFRDFERILVKCVKWVKLKRRDYTRRGGERSQKDCGNRRSLLVSEE